MSPKKHSQTLQKTALPASSLPRGFIHTNTQYLAICIIIFALTRLYMLFVFKPLYPDISVYSQFAYEYLLASKQKISFYSFHAKIIEEEQKAALQKGLTPLPDDQKTIPYPPLAIQLLRIPSLFVTTDLAWTQQSFIRFTYDYYIVFRRMLFLFDLINFIVTIFILSKRKNLLSAQKKTIITLAYVLGVLTMAHSLYDRLDIVVGTLLLIGTALLLLKKHYIWSFIALAAAVNYKLSPLVLVPLFAMASIAINDSGKDSAHSQRGFQWTLLLLRMAIITAFIALLFMPFAFLFGKESLSAFLFQYQRGLHLESVYSAVILCLSVFFDLHCSVGHGFRAFILNSSLSQPLSAISNALTLIAMIGIYFLIYRWYIIKNRQALETTLNNGEAMRERTINQLLVMGQLLCLSALIVFSKNFSPQYMFWQLPLLFLADFKIRGTVRAAIIYLCACILCTVIFPYLYFSDLVTHFTVLGKFLLIVRAAALVSFLVSMLFLFIQDRRLLKEKA